MDDVTRRIKAKEGYVLTSVLDSRKIAELHNIRKQIKELEKREKELQKEIDGYFRNYHDPETVTTPSEVVEYDGKHYQIIWGRQDRSKINPDKVRAYLEQHGMWEELSRVERVLDEEAFKKAIEEGIISLEDVEHNCMDKQIIRTIQIKEVR